jgi:putative tricarboxylic transport membrane protein
MMRKKLIEFSIWFLVSLFFAVESLRMGLGNFRNPGPGFMTFCIALVVALLALALMLQERGKKIAESAEPLFKGKKITNLILGFLFLFAYPMLLDELGFSLCNLLFVGCCLKVIAGKTWGVAVGVSSGVAISVYLLFVVWLQLSFPPGEWVSSLLSFGGF